MVWCQRARSPCWQDGGMERVLGIGGYFMRAADPAALGAWYRDCLGLDADESGLWLQRRRTWRALVDLAGSRIPRAIGSSCGSPPDGVQGLRPRKVRRR